MDLAVTEWNWLDLVIAVVLLLSVLGAVRNGLTKEVVRLVALLIGIVGGLWWHPQVAALYAPFVANAQMAAFAGFLTILFGALIAGGLVGWALAKFWGLAGLRWFDRLLGAAFGVARGLLVATALVLGLVAFSPLDSSAQSVADSKLAPLVLHGANAVVAMAPETIRQSFAKGFDQVREIWSPALAEPQETP